MRTGGCVTDGVGSGSKSIESVTVLEAMTSERIACDSVGGDREGERKRESLYCCYHGRQGEWKVGDSVGTHRKAMV